MVTDSGKDSSINWKWFGIAFGLIALAMILLLLILPRVLLNKGPELIIVKSIGAPVKIKPTDSGGKTVDHQSLLVFEMLKNGFNVSNDFETLRPNSTHPEPPPISVDENNGSDGLMASQHEGEKETKTLAIKSITLPHNLTSDKQAKNKKKAISNVDDPLFVVQLAAFRNEAKAGEVANLLSEKHNSRLKRMRLETMRFDTGADGVFYRVVSSPLSRLVAEEVCARVRQSGQDCFLRKFRLDSK